MPKKQKTKSYEDAVSWFRGNGFEVTESGSRLTLKKYNASATIERGADGGAKITTYPGCLIGGEVAKLVDHGNQKLLQTSQTKIAATADHLRALHQFAEELKEGTGGISLYNESLGTVSAQYHYDRVRGNDLPEGERPKRPWETTTA